MAGSTTLGRLCRSVARSTLRTWGRLEKAPGYYCQVVEQLGPNLAEHEPLVSRLPNGHRIGCDLGNEVYRWIWFHGLYEPIEAYLFTQLLEPGMTAIDAGANAGQYTLLAATCVGPAGSVHSFEPIPATFARLQQTVADNGLTNVSLNRAALWCEDTTLAFGIPADHSDEVWTYSVRASDDPETRVEAPALRLDTYVATHGLTRLDVIKMDIEGAEPFAIAGGRATLERFRPLILMEINPEALAGAGSSVLDLLETIRSLGYQVWRIGDSPETSGPLPAIDQLNQCNVILHHADLPASITSDWRAKAALRWARSGW